MTQNNILEKGKLLVAEPSLGIDVTFSRAVILITDLNNNGSVGFVINKPLQYTLNDLVPDIESDFQIFNGGPVEQDNLYFIHTLPNKIPNSIEIANGIYWGGEINVVKDLFQANQIQKNQIRFFLGYSGWEINQLENEIENNSWLIFNNSYQEKLLSIPAKQLWKEKIEEKGGDYLIWTNAPENPILN